jgi:EAL domain-containing protein (putative c-di-GMP-specific phosphodiesterase class I)
MVRELGLSAGQGYLLGRPSPDTTMERVDIAAIEAGRVMLERRAPQLDEGPLAVGS